LDHLKPLINIITPKKKELTLSIFSIFSTYPKDYFMNILLNEEKASENREHDRKYLNNVKWTIDNISK